MNKDTLENLADKFGERIKKNKSSYKAISKMADVSLEEAKVIASLVRGKRKEATIEVEDKLSINPNYVYNEVTDTYITYLHNKPKPIVLSGETHRAIVRAYSNFDGTPSSINEIAREFGIARNVLVSYLKAHHITHDCEPFTIEEIKSRTQEDLVEEALQIKRSALHKEIEQAKWKQTQKEALQWRKFHNDIILPLEMNHKPLPLEVKKINIKEPKRKYAAVLGLTDFHWGKYSDALENGAAYDKATASRLLFESTKDVLEKMLVYGRPEKIIVPLGSDFLHIDTDKGTTTSGTLQDMDGTPAQILTSACDLLNVWLNSLRQIAPLELVLMSGNHDRLLGISLMLYVEALFSSCKDVVVHREYTPRTYISYGENLIGFAHGDGVKKTKDLAGHMARETKQNWGLAHKVIYTGHLHNERAETDTVFGITRYQIPSLSGPDRWHSLNGFEGAPRMLPVYLHDKEEGLFSIMYSKKVN